MGMQQKKILVVDDDADSRVLVRRILTEKGYSVAQCSNGLEALEYLQTNRPDLLILDIMMPRMSGYDLASHLKQDEIRSVIPIIFMSAKNSAQEVMKGYNEYSVNYYITKPFSSKQLISGVEMVLDDGVEEEPPIAPIRKRRL